MRLRNIVKLDNIHVCPNNEALKDPLRNLKFTKINITHSALSVDYGYARDLDDKTGVRIKQFEFKKYLSTHFEHNASDEYASLQ